MTICNYLLGKVAHTSQWKIRVLALFAKYPNIPLQSHGTSAAVANASSLEIDAMKIQFDPKQQYQIDAVNAVVELFDGQPLEKTDFSVIFQTMDTELFAGQSRTELGVGNQLRVSSEKMLENLRRVQESNNLDLSGEVQGWSWSNGNEDLWCPHFSVEMETGTGKTYVYLRTIFELSRKYGFKKFIIVVPSVAIREGVLKNLEITAEHFRALFNNVEFEHFVYDAKKVNKLRQFATSNTIQVLVINIDAFRKNFTGTDAENRSNVIYKENDKLSGRQPIEFVQATRPIVIIDEPQSVDSTDKAQEAIRALNPLCTLRYSATHRNPYNLVYLLDPIRAYELRLVKQIVVASATAGDALNGAFVKIKSIGYDGKAKRPTAKLAIHVQGNGGVKEKEFKIKGGEDLHLLSNERACYQDNWVVDNVDATPGAEHVAFTNGRSLNIGQEIGGMREDVWRVQIENTVRKHLEKELQVLGKGAESSHVVLYRQGCELSRLRWRRQKDARKIRYGIRGGISKIDRSRPLSFACSCVTSAGATSRRIFCTGQEGYPQGYEWNDSGR